MGYRVPQVGRGSSQTGSGKEQMTEGANNQREPRKGATSERQEVWRGQERVCYDWAVF